MIYLLQVISKVGSKGAIYIPKRIIEELKISKGDRVLMRVKGNRLILEFIPDPLSLALKVKKWTKITTENFERESEREQRELYDA